MIQSKSILWRRIGMLAGVVFYLEGFAYLLLITLDRFLAPAVEAVKGADAAGKRQIQAVSWLVLIILLFYLGAGLTLIFRFGRYFFPRPENERKPSPTAHLDIWAEAGKRLKSSSLDGDAGNSTPDDSQ
ncbi:MAG: hypothetical protein ABSH22_11860 [Tepidisphaeraceae bacterium]